MNSWNIKKLQDLQGFIYSSKIDGEISERVADEIDRIINEVVDSEINMSIDRRQHE